MAVGQGRKKCEEERYSSKRPMHILSTLPPSLFIILDEETVSCMFGDPVS